MASSAAPPLVLSSLPLQITVGVLCASYWRGAWYIFDYTLYPHDRTKSGAASLFLGSGLLAMKQYILSPEYNGTKMLVRILPPPKNLSLRTYFMKMNRFVSLYGIAIACVLVWRGAWLSWDELADRVSEYMTLEDTKTLPAATKPTLVIKEPTKPLVPLDKSPVLAAVSPARKVTTVRDVRDEDIDAVSHHDIDSTLFYSGVASHVFATVGLLMIGRFKSVMAPPANISMMSDVLIHGKGREFARAARMFARPQA